MSMPTITPPSRLERWLRGGGYMLVGSVGIFVMLHPPETLGPALGSMLGVFIWCSFMATGVAAGIMALMGRFRGEYIMLPFFTGAVMIADANLFYRAFNEGDDGIMSRALIIGALVLAYLARYVTLRRLVRIGITLERHGKFWGRF
jgi:hypothetical protein